MQHQVRINTDNSRPMAEIYHAFHVEGANRLNSPLIKAYEQLRDSDKSRKSHFFGGRYENIYIDREHLPNMNQLIDLWLEKAGEILELDVGQLRCGYWFNEMQSGDVTEPHSHNDDDELLSGVYYLKVPENSGNLVLHEGDERVMINPEEGKLVLFSSANVHEVTRNKSDETRLSIGINFGRVRE